MKVPDMSYRKMHKKAIVELSKRQQQIINLETANKNLLAEVSKWHKKTIKLEAAMREFIKDHSPPKPWAPQITIEKFKQKFTKLLENR